MEMELDTSPAAAGTESADLCSTITALAYPSSLCRSHVFTEIPSSQLIPLISQFSQWAVFRASDFLYYISIYAEILFNLTVYI